MTTTAPIFLLVAGMLLLGVVVMLVAAWTRDGNTVSQLVAVNARMRVLKNVPVSFMDDTILFRPGQTFQIMREDSGIIWCRDADSGKPFVLTRSLFSQCLQEERLDRI